MVRKTQKGHRNYLRVRGEYKGQLVACGNSPELPPRTRRIRAFIGGGLSTIGTTSAYAENTTRHILCTHP